jgi:hypothetical protein
VQRLVLPEMMFGRGIGVGFLTLHQPRRGLDGHSIFLR